MKYFVAKIHLFGDDKDVSEENLKDSIESTLDTEEFIFPIATWEKIAVKEVILDKYQKEEKNGKI